MCCDHDLSVSSPGSTVGAATVDESIAFIAECINDAHKETKNVVTVIENMVVYCVASTSGRDELMSTAGWRRKHCRWKV